MDARTPRGQRVRWPFLVALAVALCAAGVRYTVLAPTAGSELAPSPGLTGVTGQGTTIALGVRNGHVVWLRTSLSAKCRGGSSWHETWAPAEGAPVHFTMTGRSFVTQQHDSPTYTRAITGEIGFAIQGTLTAHGGAQGTIRLVARFYIDGEEEWNACDSLDVPWAVGPRARARLGTVRLGTQVGQYYAAAPSFVGRVVGHVSPARRRFIELVDWTCAATSDSMKQAADALATRDRAAPDAPLLNDEYYVELHAWQLRQLVRLGQPPQERAPYDAWLADFRRRVALERQAVALERNGRLGAALRTGASVTVLKARGDVLGQEFGLVSCTSGGGTPVPILDDGQPLPLP